MPTTRHTETFNQNVAFIPDESELRPNILVNTGFLPGYESYVCEYYTDYNAENNTSNIMEIYKKLFSDYEILGTSGFTGVYEDPKNSAGFAYNIGADILVTAYSLVSKSDRISVVPDFWTGINTAYYTDYKFNQEGLFLRKKDGRKENIWLQTEKSFPPDGTQEELSGTYENDFYKLALYSSGDYIVAVVNGTGKGIAEHKRNMRYFEIKEDHYNPKYEFSTWNVKFFFDKTTMKGIYLRSDRCPVEAVFDFSKERNELVVKRSFDSKQSYLTFKKVKESVNITK